MAGFRHGYFCASAAEDAEKQAATGSRFGFERPMQTGPRPDARTSPLGRSWNVRRELRGTPIFARIVIRTSFVPVSRVAAGRRDHVLSISAVLKEFVSKLVGFLYFLSRCVYGDVSMNDLERTSGSRIELTGSASTIRDMPQNSGLERGLCDGVGNGCYFVGGNLSHRLTLK